MEQDSNGEDIGIYGLGSGQQSNQLSDFVADKSNGAWVEQYSTEYREGDLLWALLGRSVPTRFIHWLMRSGTSGWSYTGWSWGGSAESILPHLMCHGPAVSLGLLSG